MRTLLASLIIFFAENYSWAQPSENRELILEAFSPLYISQVPDKKYLLKITRSSSATPECLLNQKKLGTSICQQMNDLIHNETDQGLENLLNATKSSMIADSPNYFLTFKNVRKLINPRPSQELLAHPSGELTPFQTGANSLQQLSFLILDQGQN